MERDEWMSEQVAGEIEDLRRRFGFERKEAVAYWHLLQARQLMSEMGQTDHSEELEREGRSELEADFREFAGLIHDISVLGETRVFQGSATLNRGQAACSTSSSHFGFLPRHLDSSAGGTGYVNNSSIDQR